MESGGPPRFHAGDSVENLCRVCKAVRGHTVIAADSGGNALRVICDYCGSQHNYRSRHADAGTPSRSSARAGEPGGSPLVSERERAFPITHLQEGDDVDVEMLLRRIIREETGLTPVPIGEKWRGGDLVLRPGRPGLQEKSLPIETFFHKIVMLRNRLRVLEQQINGAEVPEELKLKLQAYITGCYGTLTSFNVLFAEDEDRFQGASAGD